MTLQQVADEMDVTKQTVSRWVNDGKLGYVALNDSEHSHAVRKRVMRSQLDAWIAKRSKRADDDP